MKKRRINKKVLYIVLCLVIVSIATITLAYAALSSTLNISGSTEVIGSSWNITISKVNLNERFPNSMWLTGEVDGEIKRHDDNALLGGNGKLLSSGTISSTSVKNIQISLSTPGDIAVLTYEITNNGTIPALWDYAEDNETMITSSSNNDADIQLISNYLNTAGFALVPNKIPDDGFITEDATTGVGEVICPGESIYIILGYGFDIDAPAVPSSEITISNLGASFNFTQADKSTCTSS